MLFLADENLETQIQVQLRRHYPDIDIIDVRDVGLDHRPDEDILQWAADNNRIVVTHDVNSMRGLADSRTSAGLPMPGAIIVLDHISHGVAIEFIAYVDSGQHGDMEGRTVFAKPPYPDPLTDHRPSYPENHQSPQLPYTKISRGRKAETTKLGTSTTSLTFRSTATLQMQ